MKTLHSLMILAATCGIAGAADPVTYTNFIRQVQYPSGVQWDATVAAAGSQLSSLAIDPGGANFQLWTVKSSPLTNYLLDDTYVGTYIPVAGVVIRSEDPYTTIPRTRADRPFYVDITVSGLLNGATDPEPSKSVKFLRHVQSYGVGGDGKNINRSQATLLSQTSIATNGPQTLTYTLTSVPGADRLKVRGEERFSIYSLEDYQAPESQIASKFIQIWPVADGAISGIAQNQLIRFEMPQITLTLNDLYPYSTTYAQVYKGDPVLGASGAVVGSPLVLTSESVPKNPPPLVIDGEDWDSLITEDGRWTLELLTLTPFGLERMRTPSGQLCVVSFDVDRTIRMNGTFTTIE